MENDDQLPLRFVSFLVRNSCIADTLYLPLSFCVKYAECIPEKVTVVLRNGDEFDLEFKKDIGVFVGMKKVLERFDCRNGCILAFQFNGGNNFFLHVMTSSYEVYGDIEDNAGCKFVKIMLSDPLPIGRLSLPHKFVKTFGKHIPRKVSICLINGKIIEGRYKKSTKEIFGLEEMFRITSLSLFEIVLFTYYGGGLFHASIFNVECVEKPITNDNLVLDNVERKFEVEVQNSHLLRYCLGVCISARFRPLTDKWNSVDYVKVHSGKFCFTLQIKKREGKVEIHEGWIQLRTYLKLKKGDICLFRIGSSDRDFDVEVYKP